MAAAESRLARLLVPDLSGLSSAGAIPGGDAQSLLASVIPATPTAPWSTWIYEPAFATLGPDADEGDRASFLQTNCSSSSATLAGLGIPGAAAGGGGGGGGSTISVTVPVSSDFNSTIEFECLEALSLWRSDRDAINEELYSGYYEAHDNRTIEEISAGYDFKDTRRGVFDVGIWYNDTYANKTGGNGGPPNVIRIQRSINMEFPKPPSELRLDFSSILGPLFYMWIFQLLFPVSWKVILLKLCSLGGGETSVAVIVRALVYEKEKRLRVMMRMHGLGDSAYTLVTYLYYLAEGGGARVRMCCVVLWGHAEADLKFLRINSYSVQLVFYFLFINTQIALAFLAAALFRSTSLATAAAHRQLLTFSCWFSFSSHLFLPPLPPCSFPAPRALLTPCRPPTRPPALQVIVRALVYEKEKRLRVMMRMHGLGDSAYTLVTYLYYLAEGGGARVRMCCVVLWGHAEADLKFLRINSYSVQLVFYFLFINTQIALAFLAAALFRSTSLATGAAVFALELVPAFALYRGLYELAQFSFIGNYQGEGGITWGKLTGGDNGMGVAMAILLVEWLLFGALAFYFERVLVGHGAAKRHPLFFLPGFSSSSSSAPTASGHAKEVEMAEASGGAGAGAGGGSRASNGGDRGPVRVDMESPDVVQERALVEGLGEGGGGEHSIVCRNLTKVYPARDGNPPKAAVRGLWLAIPRGQCFGMLGPNGAGKTTSLNMMIGLLQPSSGSATIEGLRLKEDMDLIYSTMGVCPQHDLLWEQLTGREHLLFYGRLKNLKGAQLTQAVEDSLRSVNLASGGAADKRAGQYSGGMKRRLSVAISLIGDPLVVYMDEPSTGLDPASRKSLWAVVRSAARQRAIILTTHSMEEAEALCDRIGIFVDGQFQCLGNPKELTARYGGFYVFTITTPPAQEQAAVQLVESLTPNARKIYGLAGTQKFELPINEVDVADVFLAVERAKGELQIQAWGVANTTLEDIFITIAKDAGGGTATLS
eukprot:jgi/Mesen1/10589/ME000085S09920